MAGKKIGELTPLGRNLISTDELELSLTGSAGSRKITGQEILNSTGITIDTTAITSGVVGRVLFEGTGNVVQESANLFWDNTNGRLGIGTSSPSAIIHSVGSVTASGLIARGNFFNNILVASANNDVLVGLDIAPTFTNGAFTGVDNFSLRINGGKGVIGTTSNTGIFPLIVRQNNYSGLLVQNSFTGTNHNSSYDGFAFWTNNDAAFAKSLITNWDNNGIYIYNSGVSPTGLVLFGGTNNVGINTTTDAGYKLDVNGTARVQSLLSVNGAAGISLYGTVNLEMYTESIGANIRTTNANMRFGTNNATRMMIAGSNVLIGTQTDVPSAQLQMSSTTQGFLPPRMTTTQKNAIASPATGLVLFDTTLNKLCVYTTAWETITSL